MIKFIHVIFSNFHRAPFMIPKMRYYADHPEKYSEKQRYELARKCVYYMNKAGKITTEVHGLENLPKSGGYMMYPNHQGKYDVLGIMQTHKEHVLSLWILINPIQCLLENLLILFRANVCRKIIHDMVLQ